MLSLLLAAALPVPQLVSPPIRNDIKRCAFRLLAEPPSARAPTPESLIELIDLGDPSPFYQSLRITVSPDRKYAAVPVRRADIATNGYCSAIAVVRIDGSEKTRLIGISTELVTTNFDWRGPVIVNESPAIAIAKWAPDGKWLAFEKKVDGENRLWVANLESGTELPVGDAGSLDAFDWDQATGNLTALRRVLSWPSSGVSGYRYDRRFLPAVGEGPFPLDSGESEKIVISLNPYALTKNVGLIEPGDAATSAKPIGAIDRQGDTATVEPIIPGSIGSATELVVRSAKGRVRCPESKCGHIEGIWWISRRELIFETRTGWAAEKSAIYRWNLDSYPQLLREADDVLSGCDMGQSELICGQESSTSPRRVVGIDLKSGKARSIFDPNANYGARELKTERLHLTNSMGTRSIADLVYPTDYHPGQRYPMVVTTYETRGFLRGGTGDEYPVPLLAQRGFLVLSFQRPRDVGMGTAGATSPSALARIENEDWADRRSVESSLQAAIKDVTSRGVLAHGRIGISGLSDGSTTAVFALLNSNVFKAASISSCCMEPGVLMSLMGPANVEYFRASGYPPLSARNEAFWHKMSLSLNADRVSAPLLMQLGSVEYRMGLDSYNALREQGKAVDLIVYPSEGHVKLEPRHRLAVYRRNLAWFEFWLNGSIEPDLIDKTDLGEWTRLRHLGH